MAWFEQNVPVESDALPPVLDVEATPELEDLQAQALPRRGDPADAGHAAKPWSGTIGKKPVIYSTVDFYAGILSNGALSDYPIWVRSTKYSPSVKYGSRRWHFWQYQSDAHIPGIDGKVDRNAFYRHRKAVGEVPRRRRDAAEELTGHSRAGRQSALALPARRVKVSRVASSSTKAPLLPSSSTLTQLRSSSSGKSKQTLSPCRVQRPFALPSLSR